MFKRKFIALDFPDPDKFDINDENKFRSVVLWLEDQKIRHYKIEDRGPLRNLQGDQWNKALKEAPPPQVIHALLAKLGLLLELPVDKDLVSYGLATHMQDMSAYLAQLNCPYDDHDKRVLLDWLLGYAVRLEFGDDVEKYKNVTPEKLQQRSGQKPVNSSNPIDNLDFDDAEFKAGVTSLAMLLQIPPYQDHLETLKAICLVVSEKFSQSALEAATKNKSAKDEHIPLDKTELGFEAGDYIMTEAAKILRLLHIRDLRDLQTKINAAIVEVQKITADPKTDTRLGKVGF